MDTHKIFDIDTPGKFEFQALEIFRFQYLNNPIYREFCEHLGKTTSNVKGVSDIPFLPIEFFKSKQVISGNAPVNITFTSSGTTGNQVSQHHVSDLKLYERSYQRSFALFYGDISDYCVLALLPSYLEREGSSLVYMVNDLIEQSGHPESGFYLKDQKGLKATLSRLDADGKEVLLIGVSFALLEMAETHTLNLKHTVVMETGGMKGRRRELIREELHTALKKGFGVNAIHSEYGMTELLSQAYSQGNGIFKCPPWMKILVRDTEDPFALQRIGKTGGINVIDLANVNSCSFIATQDLGRVYADGSFEVIGRFDHSDIRGCNLMVL